MTVHYLNKSDGAVKCACCKKPLAGVRSVSFLNNSSRFLVLVLLLRELFLPAVVLSLVLMVVTCAISVFMIGKNLMRLD